RVAPAPFRSPAALLAALPFFLALPPPPGLTLFPYTTLFRSHLVIARACRIELLIGFYESIITVLRGARARGARPGSARGDAAARSEEHTSELQSRENLVCRLLLEKKKNQQQSTRTLEVRQ